MDNKNSFENNKITGNNNIINGNGNTINIYDSNRQKEEQVAQYIAEPLWRSPFTMGILTWISFIIGVADIIPFYNLIKPFILLIQGNGIVIIEDDLQRFVIIFVVLTIALFLFLTLRSIAKNETRHPIGLNKAISGFGKRITVENIKPGACPKCGGKLRYYNKPIEWRDNVDSNGKLKREVTRRIPALECKRNKDHYYLVDPAGQKI